MLFIEFNLKHNNKKIAVNVSKIYNIFYTIETETIIDMGNDNSYIVNNTYEEVIMTIKYFEEVKFIKC